MSNPLLSAAESRQNRVDESWGHLTWLAGRPQGNVEGLTLGRVVSKPVKPIRATPTPIAKKCSICSPVA